MPLRECHAHRCARVWCAVALLCVGCVCMSSVGVSLVCNTLVGTWAPAPSLCFIWCGDTVSVVGPTPALRPCLEGGKFQKDITAGQEGFKSGEARVTWGRLACTYRPLRARTASTSTWWDRSDRELRDSSIRPASGASDVTSCTHKHTHAHTLSVPCRKPAHRGWGHPKAQPSLYTQRRHHTTPPPYLKHTPRPNAADSPWGEARSHPPGDGGPVGGAAGARTVASPV